MGRSGEERRSARTAMALTRTWESDLPLKLKLAGAPRNQERRREFVWLVGASVIVALGLLLVFTAKTQDFPEVSAKLSRGELVDLNRVSSPQEMLPFLQIITDPAERQSAAEHIASYLEQHRAVANVGALAHLRPRLPLARLKPADDCADAL